MGEYKNAILALAPGMPRSIASSGMGEPEPSVIWPMEQSISAFDASADWATIPLGMMARRPSGDRQRNSAGACCSRVRFSWSMSLMARVYPGVTAKTVPEAMDGACRA